MVGQIPLPEGASIGAVVRGEEVIMAHHDTRIAADDHVILFLADRRHREAAERPLPRSAPYETQAVAAVPHPPGVLLAALPLTYAPPGGWSLLMGARLRPQYLLAAALT